MLASIRRYKIELNCRHTAGVIKLDMYDIYLKGTNDERLIFFQLSPLVSVRPLEQIDQMFACFV